ncbi:hypothetical protein C8R47DRAFT_1221300 [Mycena vitilis]|nr:hypothetical protein C8R47DRAFT_1221300 [Mycena vitilis]
MRPSLNKHHLRFTPLLSSTLSNTSSRLASASPTPRESPPHHTHPRTASDIAIVRNSKLFASLPVDGQGALSSQVSDTQFFEQFGTDVSGIPSSPSPSLPDISIDGLSQPVEDDDSYPEDKSWNNWEWRHENSWDYDGMLASLESPPPSPTMSICSRAQSPVAVPVSLKVESTEIKLEPDLPLVTQSTLGELSPLEIWIVERIRESNSDGVLLAARLQRMKERCEFLEGRHHHHKRLLEEIHFLSRDLD